jgi:hypothetical protein
MSALHSTAVKLTAQGFDIERKLLFPSDATCKMLKPDGDTINYSVVELIPKGWICRFSEYRQRFVLEIATLLPDFRTNVVEKTTHVALGKDVFQIEDGDTIPPIGDQFSWKFFCKQTGETFEN